MPWYQLLVKNQLNTGDLRCQVRWNFEYVCEEHQIVFRDANDTTRAYILFFPEMSERLRLEGALERAQNDDYRRLEQSFARQGPGQSAA